MDTSALDLTLDLMKTPPPHARPAIFRLYFGTDIAAHKTSSGKGRTVRRMEVMQFLRSVIQRLGGVTVTESLGAWIDMQTGDLIEERMYVAEFIVADADAEREELHGLASAFSLTFAQDAVAVVELPMSREVEFIGAT